MQINLNPTSARGASRDAVNRPRETLGDSHLISSDLARASGWYVTFFVAGVITTTFILLECGNTAARRTFRGDVCALRQTLDLREELIVPTEDDWQAAWVAYERGEAGQAGIVDHVSFQVMRRLGITEAFANDKHYQAAGFTVLF